jgi:hypothetical protein
MGRATTILQTLDSMLWFVSCMVILLGMTTVFLSLLPVCEVGKSNTLPRHDGVPAL